MKFAGNYGPRRFWFKDSVFYYKRKGENIDLPKVKLLAMSDSTYMYRSKLGTYMQFEKNTLEPVSRLQNFRINLVVI